VDAGAGHPIKLELWALSAAAFGKFVAAIPPPLSIGTIRLADGRGVKGFIVEPAAVNGARDISSFGGWRAVLARAAGGGRGGRANSEWRIGKKYSLFAIPHSPANYTDTA